MTLTRVSTSRAPHHTASMTFTSLSLPHSPKEQLHYIAQRLVLRVIAAHAQPSPRRRAPCTLQRTLPGRVSPCVLDQSVIKDVIDRYFRGRPDRDKTITSAGCVFLRLELSNDSFMAQRDAERIRH